MTDNQELIKALAKLGYESYIKSQPGQIDIVQIVIDPEDFISGQKKLKADLERLGWNRSYSYKPSRSSLRRSWQSGSDIQIRSRSSKMLPIGSGALPISSKVLRRGNAAALRRIGPGWQRKCLRIKRK